MNLKEGALLHNNTYRIERVLGQGGFGITYLAVHVRLKKKVAIKEFFPKAFCDRDADTSHVRTASKANSVTVEKLKNKFIKEVEHISDMDSPYIVRIIDVFEENHTAYYIMDYIEGRSLSDIVKNDGPLSVEQAVDYITKIGEALTYIHSKRMNHLDVKPANIMVRSKDNTPILIDFGLSKQYDSDGNQTSTTPVGISHGYAPIEQYKDGGVREFSPQTDLYSLAATFFYLITGTVPPQALNLIDEELTFPATASATIMKSVRKAMSPMKKARHNSVAEFIEELSEDFNEDTSQKYTDNDSDESTMLSVNDNIVEQNQVNTNTSNKTALSKDINGHEFIDLGLPSGLKWSIANVGSLSPEDFGDYFAWGEVVTKHDYTDDTYAYCCPKRNLTNMFRAVTGGIKEYKYEALGYLKGPELDVAEAEWGHPWHTPTIKDFRELIRCCEWKWDTRKGVKGYSVTGPNGNNIFLPATGNMQFDSLEDDNNDLWYWTCEQHDRIDSWAMALNANKKERYIMEMGRECGLCVRPVAK